VRQRQARPPLLAPMVSTQSTLAVSPKSVKAPGSWKMWHLPIPDLVCRKAGAVACRAQQKRFPLFHIDGRQHDGTTLYMTVQHRTCCGCSLGRSYDEGCNLRLSYNARQLRLRVQPEAELPLRVQPEAELPCPSAQAEGAAQGLCHVGSSIPELWGGVAARDHCCAVGCSLGPEGKMRDGSCRSTHRTHHSASIIE